MAGARYVPRKGAIKELERAAGMGLQNYLFALEAAAKRNAPVRGGHRSFAPGGPVGGTLRRSIHSVVYVDGKRIAGGRADENKRALPDYAPGKGVVGFVGTNVEYGVFVHDGTVRMRARPFITEAVGQTIGEAPGLIKAGIAAALKVIEHVVDPMGQLVTELRAFTALTAIVGTRISTDEDPVADQRKSRVRLVDGGLPAGLGRPGMRRAVQQVARYVAKCYGPSIDAQGRPIATGPITARQIAGTVMAAVHQKGPRKDAQGRVIHMTNAVSMSELLNDPDTGEPYHDVVIEVVAGAEAGAVA